MVGKWTAVSRYCLAIPWVLHGMRSHGMVLRWYGCVHTQERNADINLESLEHNPDLDATPVRGKIFLAGQCGAIYISTGLGAEKA